MCCSLNKLVKMYVIFILEKPPFSTIAVERCWHGEIIAISKMFWKCRLRMACSQQSCLVLILMVTDIAFSLGTFGSTSQSAVMCLKFLH